MAYAVVSAQMPWAERVQGLILCVVGLAVPAVAIASFFTDVRAFRGSHELTAYSLLVLGALIGVTNFYLSFIRPAMHRLLRSGEPLRRISGIPLLGNVAVVGLALAPPSQIVSVVTLVQVAIDTGGLQYAVRAIASEVLRRD